ncbi:hypothetical protein QAD02_019227 [Eretmocerus hayati]|uniref:Uncharacterized protein n=1 Tax=Eretmocerus hayati TaxID=131215 RepID=A0ACC2PJ28_9HYME|nr:hypothetical protein QAD02_019227 [Eretmocerus hayati]
MLLMMNLYWRRVKRVFTINNPHREFVLKYAKLRPNNAPTNRFFLNYQNGKCTRQPVEINKIGNIAKEIAVWLRSPNPEGYTGHCFRHTSASMLIDSGISMPELKRHGSWKADSSAEGYYQQSETKKRKTNDMLLGSLMDEESTDSSTANLMKGVAINPSSSKGEASGLNQNIHSTFICLNS